MGNNNNRKAQVRNVRRLLKDIGETPGGAYSKNQLENLNQKVPWLVA